MKGICWSSDERNHDIHAGPFDEQHRREQVGPQRSWWERGTTLELDRKLGAGHSYLFLTRFSQALEAGFLV
jgi:hypothetical protein